MGHKDLNGDDEQRLLLKKQTTVKIRAQVTSEKAVKESRSATGSLAASHSGYGWASEELQLDRRWILDPNLLRVGAKIGEGAHGKVYEGRYRDMSVAIKVLQRAPTLEEQEKLEARFVREVDMMSRVQHKNMVKFIGACKDPVMAITTELLPGRSLRKHLLSLRPSQLDLHVAVSYALDVANAMECLHNNGIIHRDLKPDNLLLTANQKSVKLVDFGLAREESLTEMMTAETGTYRWMAPELYSTVTLRLGDKKHYNNKVDVYSFGIVLWELVTNRLPFEGMSNLQAAYAAAFKNARPTIPDGLPEELVFILQSCWAEEPNMRPTFGQVVQMLATLLPTIPEPEPRVPTHSLSPKLNSILKDDISDGGSPKQLKDDLSDGGSPAKSKRRFLCFGQCFASDNEQLVCE
ncbi:hypothetical protein GOP47_0006365 [Adiantum capillus-veneris]|uniref:Protein kinase domain-containing protein n=1 Tax=Adiantum capillus-veneris TaxID=13818 RepID=A0A9D4V345_ADICA|nr:hypothetical protein GOP47_0006365 [Adiantum capillus-veneris]